MELEATPAPKTTASSVSAVIKESKTEMSDQLMCGMQKLN
jgi:hypothetical protein